MGNVHLFIQGLATVIEYIGLVIIFASLVFALYRFLIMRSKLNIIRCALAHRILFGLEFIIAADIILVIVADTREDLIRLAVLVVIWAIVGHSLKTEDIADPRVHAGNENNSHKKKKR